MVRALADELGETANIAVLDEDVAVNIMQARGSAAVTVHNWLGRRTPLHATSSGKVLLAALPPGRQDAVLLRRPARFTEHTITSVFELREQLAEIAREGYAICVEELEVGLYAVAAPVGSHDGSVIAALSVSGPSYRIPVDQLPDLAKRGVDAAVHLSRRTGYGGHTPRPFTKGQRVALMVSGPRSRDVAHSATHCVTGNS